MKPTTLLLAASLVANVALLALVATRPADSAPPRSVPADAPHPASASRPSAAAPSVTPSADTRDLALGRAFARYQDKLRAAAGKDSRWWRDRATSSRSREEELLARRELSEALFAAFGDDLGFGGADRSSLAFLSPEKRTALLRINQDYDEMMARFGSGGIQLASDREKLRLLRAERDRDITALLSPAELADYELRTSPSAATLRARYGDALATEEDFKKLYALQKAFDEKFPNDALTGRLTPETLRARSEAQRQLQEDIRGALGDEKFTALRRATDPELRALDSLVARLSLPANTADRVAGARESYAAESQRINADPALSLPDRRTQLQSLGTRAKADLATTLGAEVADAFAPRASWVGLLQNGLAFSTTPIANSPGSLSLAGGATQSVFPVMPAGLPGAGGTQGVRQVVNVISTSSETTGAPGNGAFFLGAPSGPTTTTSGTMQVISIGGGEAHGPQPLPATPAPKP